LKSDAPTGSKVIDIPSTFVYLVLDTERRGEKI
jgi:hypothetical protein